MTRNYWLDGLRGLAALGVACYHAGVVIKPNHFPGGYLAVDFFFVLSGFVVDSAYRGRIDRGLTSRQFMVLRLYRLYPAFAIGALLGLAILVIKMHRADPGAAVHGLAAATLLNAAMLPILSGGWPNIFPLDSPAWSLFCEMVMNLLFVAGLVRAGRPLLWATVIVGAAGMIMGASTMGAGLNLGWRADTLLFGFSRALFGFTMGMILARSAALPRGLGAVAAAASLLLLVAAMTMPVAAGRRAVFDLAFAFAVVPFIVALGVGVRLPESLNPVLSGLGAVSYPLYALHFPIFQLLHGSLGGRLPPTLLGAVAMAAAIAAAIVVERWIDVPARRRGSAYLRRVTDGRLASSPAGA